MVLAIRVNFKSTPVEISFGLRETADSSHRVEVIYTTPLGKVCQLKLF